MSASLALRHAEGRGLDDYDIWDEGRVVGNITRLNEPAETWSWAIHVSPTHDDRSGRVASLEEAKAKFLHEYGRQLADGRRDSIQTDSVAVTSVAPAWKLRLPAVAVALPYVVIPVVLLGILGLLTRPPHSPIVQTSTHSELLVPAGIDSSTRDNRVPSPFFDCSDCPEMVVVPSGSFVMGTSEANDKIVYEMNKRDLGPFFFLLGRLFEGSSFLTPLLSEQPQHSVSIPHQLGMGKYPVTRREFAAFVRESGYSPSFGCTVHVGKYVFSPGAGWATPGFSQTDYDPAVCVSWNDAHAYVAWLNRKLGAGTSGPYRLPSESEWEYGARAGTQTLRWWGNSIGSGNADCDGCGSRWDRRQTAPVNEFRPNPFGLSDVLGNVFEWTEDCPHPNYEGAPADGSAWTTGNSCRKRVTRGAGFFSRPPIVRSAQRTEGDVDLRLSNTGFRVARTLP
jgi:formylglycine-generating enzyme required for sulfatase activity